jgi:outer membrane protein
VQRAMSMRPELRSVDESLIQDDLTMKLTHNAMLPDFQLRGNYTTTGRGGNFYDRNNALLNPASGGIVPGGFGDALDQVFGFGFPIYSFGVQLRLPLRDRNAASNYADAVVSKKLDTLRRRSTEQNIRQDVLTSISQVESSKASVRLAVVNRDLAQKQLDAEQKKYDLGTSVIFFVLDAQTRLITAESQLVNQSVLYRRNILAVQQKVGTLFEERGITVQ